MIDNPKVAGAVLRHCEREGVREYCLAAGARNAPIALALLEESSEDRTIYHFFDERSAGFFALGRSLASRRPVAVVTTSGTAVAELLPAMVEAYYQAVPLVAVTADRPVSFRGSGAPQAIEQAGIFGVYAESVDVLDGGEPRLHFRDRPVHLNVPLGEPRPEPVMRENTKKVGAGKSIKGNIGALPEAGRETLERFVGEGDLAVVLGTLHPEEAVPVGRFLNRLGAPTLAEPASNLRGSQDLEPFEFKGGSSKWGALLGQKSKILRIGGVPVGRWWRDLEDTEHEILNLSRSGHPGISRSCTSVRVGDFLGLDGVSVPKCHVSPSSSRSDAGIRFGDFPKSEPALIRSISEIIPSGDAVFLGNSLPVRDWDLAAISPRAGTAFFANRGANGIDGALSTALGVGADYPGIWAVLGDLTTLYDLSGPWVIDQLRGAPKIRIVVINNGGGRIFSHLPAFANLEEAKDAVIQNRHSVEFGNWAAMWGLEYYRVGNSAELAGHCDCGLPDQVVIEIVPDEEETSAFWHRYRG